MKLGIFLISTVLAGCGLVPASHPGQEASQVTDIDSITFEGEDLNGIRQCRIICAEGCVHDNSPRRDSTQIFLPCHQALRPDAEQVFCTKSLFPGRSCVPNPVEGGDPTLPPPSIQPSCEDPLPENLRSFSFTMEQGVTNEQFCSVFVHAFSRYLQRNPRAARGLWQGGEAEGPAAILVAQNPNVVYERELFHRLEVYWNIRDVQGLLDASFSSVPSLCGDVRANQWCDEGVVPAMLWAYQSDRTNGRAARCPSGMNLASPEDLARAHPRLLDPTFNDAFAEQLSLVTEVWSGDIRTQSRTANESPYTMPWDPPCNRHYRFEYRHALDLRSRAMREHQVFERSSGQMFRGNSCVSAPVEKRNMGPMMPVLCTLTMN